MFIKKTIIRRFMMTLLLVGALGTTFQSITGVKASTLPMLIFSDAGPSFGAVSVGDFEQPNKRNFAFSLQNLYAAASTTTYKPYLATMAKPAPPKLEEEVDWSVYPVKVVEATGYTAGVESTGKNPGHPLYGITYSGVKVKRDLYSTIAADPSVFPIGTILFIPDYGYGVVADTGSAIKGNKIDLYYETVAEVYNEWGKQTVEVYVVELGNGKITEEELTALNEDESMQVFRESYLPASRDE